MWIEGLLIWKLIFLIALFLISISLITWKLKDLPSKIRKPLVILIYPITYLPRVLIALLTLKLNKRFWQEAKENFRIAWNGHI